MKKLFILLLFVPIMATAQKHELSDTILNFIETNIVDPKLWIEKNVIPSKEVPDWQALTYEIGKSYNHDYSRMSILYAKVNWYRFKRDSSALASIYVDRYSAFPPDSRIGGFDLATLNNILYSIVLQYSNSSADLKRAIAIAAKLTKSNPDIAEIIDTYANLLYKSGQVKKAITWETRAHQIKPNDTGIFDALNKMKKNQKTWKVDLK